MKRNLLILAALVLVALAGIALCHYFAREDSALSSDVAGVPFIMRGEFVTLHGGVAEDVTGPDGISKTVVRYFGNEVRHDIDGDGTDDVVFLITQETGSSMYFYAVGALKRDKGYQGTAAVMLGEGIAPQTTEKGEGRSVVVNYAEKTADSTSINKSIHLVLDTKRLEFGELVQGFEGEER
ncbi:MAG: hypothetical protein AB199_01825 [Parcubacteria bacterium C7867-004]|nr:MAG: hypothetical protein AB199_01825 [Parcubacteria bacterium C7867-004]